MHSKTQLKLLLDSAGARPKKHYGQNFLIDLELMKLFVETADIHCDELIMEVGCGTGSLTGELAARAGVVIAVELDITMADIAKQELSGRENVMILNTDILKTKNELNPLVMELVDSLRSRAAGKFKLVANLPYNAASPAMVNLAKIGVDEMCVTIQREVAERIVASSGTKDYGILTVMLRAFGDAEIFRIIKPGSFWPAPKIDSAMLKWKRNQEKIDTIKDVTMLTRVVNVFMQHRRKQMSSCVKIARKQLLDIDWNEIFEKAAVRPEMRPGDVTTSQYVTMANICSEIVSSQQ